MTPTRGSSSDQNKRRIKIIKSRPENERGFVIPEFFNSTPIQTHQRVPYYR